ncbi:hypothetical protein, partial [Rhizobium sp. RHZ02]|uniref:hypothetical protein n=1 Tax=Rhizobium sp. RHZ02 TaxID=2769306 RepID=UPI001AED8981
NQGGLDTGSVGDNTYHVFLIQRSDTGVVDVLFSLSATSPTMPTNYDRKRRIGSILRTGGANRLFIQIGNRFMLAGGPIGIRNSTAATAGGTLVTTVAPFGVRVQPLLTSLLSMNSSSTASNWISDGDGGAGNFIFQNVGAGQLDQVPIFGGIYTDLSARINWSTTIGAGTIAANVLSSIGWIDSRGING